MDESVGLKSTTWSHHIEGACQKQGDIHDILLGGAVHDSNPHKEIVGQPFIFQAG
jgi:hypothetical protein